MTLAQDSEGLNGRDIESLIGKLKERAFLRGKKLTYDDFAKGIERKKKDKEALKKVEGSREITV